MRVRRALHAFGARFTVNRRDLPGRPDIVLSRARMAVFIDGCFWHACPQHAVYPKNNAEWWRTKLEATTARDARKDDALRAAGWVPVHFWEHEDAEAVARTVLGLWKSRTGRA